MKVFQSKFGQVQLVLITLIWLMLLAMPVLFGETDNGINWEHIFKIWQEYIMLFVILLINRFILMPKLFFKGKRILYFASLFVIFAFTTSVFYINGQANRPNINREMDMRTPPAPRFNNFNGQNRNQELNQRPPGGPGQIPMPKGGMPPFMNLLIMSVLLIGFDSGLLFFSKWMESEQNKLKAEKESVENKMAFLQNQISPHFFMNTLNNIHALVDIDTEEAKEAIIKLSKMMDYMLYESQTANISINQEMEFINSYVDLMKLRFTEDVKIVLDIPKDFPSIKIPPLLTISFIENAFKYGVSYEYDSFINIHFDVTDTHLNFNVENSLHQKAEKKKNSGIGIANTKNRLELIYGSDYNLEINENKNNSFFVKLNIPL